MKVQHVSGITKKKVPWNVRFQGWGGLGDWGGRGGWVVGVVEVVGVV